MPSMYLGWLGPILIVLVIFTSIGLLCYAEHLEEKEKERKKRVAGATNK